MPITMTGEPTLRKLRLWPGVVALGLQWFGWLVLPVVAPQWAVFGLLGAAVFGLAILLWWLFFSRAPWSERVGAIAAMAIAVAATSFLVDPSISNGFMGRMLYLYSIPMLSLGLVAGAVAGAMAGCGLSAGRRHAVMAGAIVIAGASLTLIRTGGISGEADSDIHWRWTPTPEERLLAQAGDEPTPPPSEVPALPPAADQPAAPPSEIAPALPTGAPPSVAPAVAATADWPGFRGPNRDGVIAGLRIDTDWAASPPVELWRKPIGPGWASFAADGDFIYTQEQRGDDEVVSCYSLRTGEPVWRHRDAVRFWESNGGAGPRGTPTLSNGRIYALGATGILNALDARSGARLWSRNAATDTSVEVPDWGVTSSPLVVGNVVIVAISGRLIAYDIVTGTERWLGLAGGSGYSSPHLLTLDGVAQVVLLRGSRTISVAPADGTLLWEHTWEPGAGFVQPVLVPGGDILLTVGDALGGKGIRRIAVTFGEGAWSVKERWTSRGLKPYFNDFVVHEGHAFGFDGSILASINLENGERAWKGGRYGHGQLVVLPEQDLLLVLSEEGELALVRATPNQFTEVTRLKALEGKTWNHPALVGDVLLVRNGEEMAAFRLPATRR